MRVELSELKPNPRRNFYLDPIGQEEVEVIKKSIEQYGFWGGIVCRKTKSNVIEIAAGHHRVKAAIEAGIKTADIFVSRDMDDESMDRVYAMENATQRGNIGTARTGAVATALRAVAYKILVGRNLPTKREDRNEHHGIGWTSVLDYLHDIPGINASTVKQDLASLKKSGYYAKIIAEVEAEIEQEAIAAQAEAKRIEQEQKEAEERGRTQEAARKANEAQQAKKEAATKTKATHKAKKASASATNHNPRVFDFEGVSRHLKTPHHIDIFRESVTSPGISPYLAIDKQEALAKHLVDLARERKKELTGTFIKENITTLVLDAKRFERKLSEEEEEALRRNNQLIQAKEAIKNFCGACRSMQSSGMKIKKLIDDWPTDLQFPFTGEFRQALLGANKIITKLLEVA